MGSRCSDAKTAIWRDLYVVHHVSLNSGGVAVERLSGSLSGEKRRDDESMYM